MKVLFCDQIDKSLICDDVIDVWWNKDTKNLTFESMGSKYYIANVDFSLANSIIREFYKYSEFENPTPLNSNIEDWKLATIFAAHQKERNRSMVELLFCMLRSGKK